jgi:hypothetical protein
MTIITNLELLIVQQRYEQLPHHLVEVEDDNEGIDRVAIQGMSNMELLRFLEELSIDANTSINSSSTCDDDMEDNSLGFDDEDIELFSLDDSLRATRNRVARGQGDARKSGVITSGGDDDDSLVLHRQRIHPARRARRRNERPNPSQEGPAGNEELRSPLTVLNVDYEDYTDTLKPPARPLVQRIRDFASSSRRSRRGTPPAGCASNMER